MYTLGPATFTDTDAQRTFLLLGSWWQHLTGTADAAAAAEDAGREMAAVLASVTGAPAGRDEPVEQALARLGAAADGLGDRREREQALAAVWAGMQAASRALRSAGAVATSGTGTVVQLSVSAGGVPKQAVDEADVTWSGMSGDRQANRTHHGRPWQALCLWSAEVIETLTAEGHPIGAGCAGENIALRGLDWAEVRPGVLLQVGSVTAEVTAYAVPCRHNARWFRDGRFDRIHHDRGPVSRVYARVVQPGHIAIGDPVTLLP